MSSITISLTDNSSLLHSSFHPEIILDERYNYSCCLLDLYTFNSIPNIHENNNKLMFWIDSPTNSRTLEIPPGSYEAEKILDIIAQKLKKTNINFTGNINENTMKCTINADAFIDFRSKDSIGSVLGFDRKVLKIGLIHHSDEPINIQGVNNIKIDCDLISGSFHNGQSTHTIYEFSPSVDPGYKMNEQPRHLIYLPIMKRRINEVNLSINDQNGKLVDFRGETITCRLHIRRDS